MIDKVRRYDYYSKSSVISKNKIINKIRLERRPIMKEMGLYSMWLCL